MAYQTGVATDYLDLLNQLIAFVTNESLMGSTQKWTVLRNITESSGCREVIFQAPGIDGTKKIFTGIRTTALVTSTASYLWILNGFTGYNANYNWFEQPGSIPLEFRRARTENVTGFQTYTNATFSLISNPAVPDASPAYPKLSLLNSSMTYWISANGQRLILVVKTGTYYQACYLGFYNAYGVNSYPLFVGGSMTGINNTDTDTSYRMGVSVDFTNTKNNTDFRMFTDPGTRRFTRGADFNQEAYSQAAVLVGDQWRYLINKDSNDYNVKSQRSFMWPTNPLPNSWNYNFSTSVRPSKLGLNIDGTRPTYPFMIHSDVCLGELDGMLWTTGISLSAETVVTIGTDSYLAVSNVYRSAADDFWLLKEA